jgi:hypothetical protein
METKEARTKTTEIIAPLGENGKEGNEAKDRPLLQESVDTVEPVSVAP